jgi:peptidyl-tRNA hydrolase
MLRLKRLLGVQSGMVMKQVIVVRSDLDMGKGKIAVY